MGSIIGGVLLVLWFVVLAGLMVAGMYQYGGLGLAAFGLFLFAPFVVIAVALARGGIQLGLEGRARARDQAEHRRQAEREWAERMREIDRIEGK